MTRSFPRSSRPWRSHKWFGRLLGCVTWSRGATSSARSSVSLSSGRSSEVDLPPPACPVSCGPRAPRFSGTAPLRSQHKHPAPSPEDPDNNNVVLLSIKDRSTPTDHHDAPEALALEKATECSRAAADPFGDLEMALFAEGLLEFRDSRASIPVLTIGYGFSDDELKALSQSSHTYAKGPVCKAVHCGGGGLGRGELWNEPTCCLEPQIDGLPASVWLECVEPTLSILISLNSLRRRRSNLSLKKGIPENAGTNRCRHGDFEVGPIAIFHHPGRIQQMMLLRVEFLNAAVNAAASNNPNNNVNQSAEHNSRRGYNRHRRFRHAPLDEISLGNISNVSCYLNDPINISGANNGNSNNSNSSSQHNGISRSVSYGCGREMEQNTSEVSQNVNQLHHSVSMKDGCSDGLCGCIERPVPLLRCDHKVDVVQVDGGVENYEVLPYPNLHTEDASESSESKLKVENPDFPEAFSGIVHNVPGRHPSSRIGGFVHSMRHEGTWRLNWNCNAGGNSGKAEPLLHGSEAVVSPLFKKQSWSQDDGSQECGTEATRRASTHQCSKSHHRYDRLTDSELQNSYKVSTNWRTKLRAAAAYYIHRPGVYFQGYHLPKHFHDDEDQNNNAKSIQSAAAVTSSNGELGILNESSEPTQPPDLTCSPAAEGGTVGGDSSGVVLGSLVIASAAVMLGTTMPDVVLPAPPTPGQCSAGLRLLSQLCPLSAQDGVSRQQEVEAEEAKKDQGVEEEEEKEQEKEAAHEDGGDNILKRFLPPRPTPATAATTPTLTFQPPPADVPSTPHPPSPAAASSTIATPTTTTTATTTTVITTTTQPVDMLALGDNALWSLLPSDPLGYHHRPPTRWLGTLAHPEGARPSVASPWSTRRRLLSYPRRLVRRARGAWFRWRVRIGQSTTSSRGAREHRRRVE